MTQLLPPQPQFGTPLPVTPSPNVLRFLALRRSTPAVTLTKPSPSGAELLDMLRIASRSPDHGKLSPWRFVVLAGEDKTAFVERLEALAVGRKDTKAVSKLVKLRTPPLAIAVISRPRGLEIPEWEQVLSAGAVCANLLNAALAMGYGANWITDWYSYDAEAKAILGCAAEEKVAAFMLLGTPAEAPLERERPELSTLVTRWTPPAETVS